jgi:hypothetical protein
MPAPVLLWIGAPAAAPGLHPALSQRLGRKGYVIVRDQFCVLLNPRTVVLLLLVCTPDPGLKD